MTSVLAVFGVTEIAIITALAVAVVALVALNVYFIARAGQKNVRPRENDETVVMFVSPSATQWQAPQYTPLPAAAAEEEPQTEPCVQEAAQEESYAEEIYARLKLDRSFTAKLVHTSDETKQLYAELKRELLSYDGVHSRTSWRRETFGKSREALARFGVRGKTLCLFLAMRPEEFGESKFRVEDASANNSYEDTPLMYRIKNPLRMRYAKELIAILMEHAGIARGEYAGGNLLEDLNYRGTEALIEEGLIRVPEGMELPASTA